MRTVKTFLPFVGMAIILFVSAYILKEKYYAVCTLLFAILSCLMVMRTFEKHTTNIRKTVLIAVMTTLSILSRFFFAMIPGFKPMTAIITLTGIYLGPEAGFFSGAFTALISNLYFGQGPWTPFQMLSFGFIGLLAGVLGRALKKSRTTVLLYGVFAGFMYSLIMDIWTVLWYNAELPIKLYGAAIVTALPYTLSYVISNVIFLFVLYKPFSRKLERIVYKIGL